jgi:hypothetical protein
VDPALVHRADWPGDPVSTQRAAEISGPIAVELSGLPRVEHAEFRARAAVSAAGSSPHPAGPASERPTPTAPGGSGPVAADAGGPSGGGAGSSSSGGNNTIPLAVLEDADCAPLVFALSELTTPEWRITCWYPEVVVGPG